MLKSLNQVSMQGYSLIELVVTIVLTSLVMVLFYSFFASNQVNSVTPVTQVKAAQLAQAYLEEISLRRFDENSPVGNAFRCNSTGAPACSNTLGSDGEARPLYDDVDDYDDITAESPPQDALGNVRSGFNNFSVDINVTYAGGDFGLAAQDLKRIQVTVTSPEGSQFVFSNYKGNF